MKFNNSEKVGFKWKVDLTYIRQNWNFALTSCLLVLNQEVNSLDLILPMCNENTTHNIGLNTNFLKELKGGFAYKNV